MNSRKAVLQSIAKDESWLKRSIHVPAMNMDIILVIAVLLFAILVYIFKWIRVDGCTPNY